MRVYVHEFERAQRSADRRNRLARLYPETGPAAAGAVVPITPAGSSDQAT
jgi:hypothetical protein